MSVLRRPSPGVDVPEDFGLGLAVAAMLAGLVVLVCVAVSAVPREGPRGEARPPEGKFYTDIQPQSVPGQALIPAR